MTNPSQRPTILIALLIAVLFVLPWLVGVTPEYGEICSNQHTNHKDCATYHIVLVVLWHILEALNRYSGAFLGVVTLFLAVFTYRLWREAARTHISAREAADAAKRHADAAISTSAPFLYPRVTRFHLYPDATQGATTHAPRISLAFLNIGKTPAILRRAGVMLYLSERDGLPIPPIPIEEIKYVDRSDVIAPSQVGGHRNWHHRDITPTEISALNKRTTPNGSWMRFYAIGFVVFDDVFGTRTTSRFSLKIMQHGFQEVRGGGDYEGYNSVSRSPIGAHKPDHQ